MAVEVVYTLRGKRSARSGKKQEQAQEPLDGLVAEVAAKRGLTPETVWEALARGLGIAVRRELASRARRQAKEKGLPDSQIQLPSEVEIRWEGTPARPVAYVRFDPSSGDWQPAGISTAELKRQLVTVVRQVLHQGLAEAGNREQVARIEEAVGELAHGKVVGRVDDGWEVALAGRLNGVRGLLPDDRLSRPVQVGDTVWAVVQRLGDLAGPAAVLDQRGDRLVIRLLEANVLEIAEGVVEVMDVAREPGQGTMVSVRSRDRRVDSVGAVVGPGAGRVRQIMGALGEPVWVVKWAEDLCEYVRHAMAPVQAETRILGWDGRRWHVQVTVPRGQVERAIGKAGIRAKLVSRLCGCRVSVVEEAPIIRDWTEGGSVYA